MLKAYLTSAQLQPIHLKELSTARDLMKRMDLPRPRDSHHFLLPRIVVLTIAARRIPLIKTRSQRRKDHRHLQIKRSQRNKQPLQRRRRIKKTQKVILPAWLYLLVQNVSTDDPTERKKLLLRRLRVNEGSGSRNIPRLVACQRAKAQAPKLQTHQTETPCLKRQSLDRMRD